MLAKKLLSACGGEEKLYVDDVFQVVTRTGTSADVTVNTGIDMTKGYMLWSKSRSAATDHAIYDSARGVTFDLVSNSTAAQTTQATGLKAVSSTGHTVGSLAKMNTSAATYVDFVFRKAPKLFDCGTYTGNGVAGRQIPHSLGVAPGMVIVKCTSSAGTAWFVKHASNSAGKLLQLDLTTAEYTNDSISSISSSTSFTVTNSGANSNGASYVWYAFAHDTSSEGIIQCGSYTGNGVTPGPFVNLGWEPQFILTKCATSAGFDWAISDNMRGLGAASSIETAKLCPNTSAAEAAFTNGISISATGFTPNVAGYANISGATHIYLAIRRPNKPPTTGTQVYNAIARTGTGAAATVTGVGFAPDLALIKKRSGAQSAFFDRLRGATRWFASTSTDLEITTANTLTNFDRMDGVDFGADGTFGIVNGSAATYINHFFRRAYGVFDVVCYTGTGVARTVEHSLGVAPELMIVKCRSAARDWPTYAAPLGSTQVLFLNTTAATLTESHWNSTAPTSSVFALGTQSSANQSTLTYIAYLFASSPGISKVGSYTGNGSSQTIDCGFSAGARFVLIKQTDAVGGWFVFDTARGIVSGNDPYLLLNSTAAESTVGDIVDPTSVGFVINETTGSLNTGGASYIYLAFA